jgi:predicted DsbA family dithiol-disulfide isomerase
MSGAAPVCNDNSCTVPVRNTASGVFSSANSSNDKKVLNIDIISDNICPFCYVGKKRLEKALESVDKNKTEININWLPFELDPTLPTQSINKLEHYKKKFGPARTAQMLPYMKETGKGEGINFSYGGNIGNTINSHRLVEWAKKQNQQDQMINALFRAYFEEEKDIADINTLADIAASIGLDRAAALSFLQGDQYRDEVVKEIGVAKQAEISGVPHFKFNNTIEISGAQDSQYFVHVLKKLGYTS